jgi:hypothetical protein
MLVVVLVVLLAVVTSAAGWASEDWPSFKRVDVSPAIPDRGQWLGWG